MKTFFDLLASFPDAKPDSGGQYIATCPVCGKEKHLYISPPEKTQNGNAAILYCQRCGAKAPDILAAVGLPSNYMYVEGSDKPDKHQKRSTEQTALSKREHIYHNADGSIFGKKIICTQPSGEKRPIYWNKYESGKYIKGLKGAKAPLYNAHILSKSKCPVFFAEGEKDADTLSAMGITATTTPNGGGQREWLDIFSPLIEGREITILTDNDDVGEQYGRFVAENIFDFAASVRIISAKSIYPSVKHKGDISDIVADIGIEKAMTALLEALEDAKPYVKGEQELRHTAKTAAEFDDVTFSFVWHPYIPRGDYTVLMADGGTGKTMLCCGIAAELSNGGHGLPGESLRIGDRAPANVLIISAEDPGELLKKRLKASGADLSKIYILDCRDSEGMNFTSGISDFERTIKEYSPQLVIIDPWHAFLGADVDINKVNAVRPVFQKITNLAKRCNCGFLLISHVNKRSQGENANNAATGSADFINAARSVLRVIFDTSPGEDSTRIVVHTKSNYAAAGQSIKFQITDASGLLWTGWSDITKKTLEEAARHRKTPYEVIQHSVEHSEDHTALINAIRQLSERGNIVRVSYAEMFDLFGANIFCGSQPKRVLDKLSYELHSHGMGLTVVTGKKVKYKGESLNGFSIVCTNGSAPPEQMSVDENFIGG